MVEKIAVKDLNPSQTLLYSVVVDDKNVQVYRLNGILEEKIKEEIHYRLRFNPRGVLLCNGELEFLAGSIPISAELMVESSWDDLEVGSNAVFQEGDRFIVGEVLEISDDDLKVSRVRVHKKKVSRIWVRT